MNLNEKIRIILEEEGWVKLDYSSILVSGEVDKIIKEMQDILDDDIIISLCERVGIVSAGFLFHDIIKNETHFYKMGNPDPTYKTPYLWDDRQMHKDWSDCVHELFVLVRTLQVKSRKEINEHKYSGEKYFEYSGEKYFEYSEEEYFVNLQCDQNSYRFLEDEKEWKETNHIHYCTVGEMLYTTFVWRLLYIAKNSEFGNKPVGQILFGLDNKIKQSDCIWRKNLVLDLLKEQDKYRNVTEGKGTDKIFSEFWENKVQGQRTWGNEWETLLLSNPDSGVEKLHRLSTYRFVYKCGFIPENPTLDLNNAELFNLELQRAIPGFLRWINEGIEISSVNEALEVLEAKARFPILPFYYWNGMNKKPMCYMVTPIWTSQHYSIQTPAGQCHHLGLALSAVKPLANLDWTLEAHDSERISSVDILVIINLLRLMARPLVESNLYFWLSRENRLNKDELVDRFIKDNLRNSFYTRLINKIRKGNYQEAQKSIEKQQQLELESQEVYKRNRDLI